MTRDAKVGLLLGLLFIFIIAFLINGLPSLRHNANNNELTSKMASHQNDLPALGAKERKVKEAVERSKPVRRMAPVRQQPLDKIQTAVKNDASTRFEMPLPKSTPAVKDVSTKKVADEIKQAAATIIAEKQSPVKPTPKTYVVVEGDNLAAIAKKFYGDQEGNKLKNITRIFEANRESLKTPDEVYVGQKLVIPLLTTTQDKDETKSIFPDKLFEKVKSIGQRHLSAETTETKQNKTYVVQEGDSLWKIAAEQLGDGNLYPEISKLNTDILEDEDTLFVGMKLRLPGR
jgi:nucleoid-associated protein YgaU